MCEGTRYATIENSGISAEWTPILQGAVPNATLSNTQFGLSTRKCFFFAGPAGTGKHRAAVCFAGSLKKAAGFDCFHVRNSILDLADKEELMDLVDGFLETANSNGNNMFCLIENPSSSENTTLFLNMLMEEMQYTLSTMKLILVVTDTDTSVYREEWQDLMMVCQFGLPNRIEREHFFKVTATPKLKFKAGFGEVYLSQKTEDMNYNQMKQIVDLLRMKVQQRALETYTDADGNMNVQKLKDEIARGFFTVASEEIDWAVMQVKKNKNFLAENRKNTSYNAVVTGTNIYPGLQAVPGMYVPETSVAKSISPPSKISTEIVGEIREDYENEEIMSMFD